MLSSGWIKGVIKLIANRWAWGSAYESGWWCQAKYEHQAGHAGIHDNPESGNHHQAPSYWETQWRYLPACILIMASQERGKGRGKLLHKYKLEIVRPQSEYASSNAKRRPVCRIGAHDPWMPLTSIGSILT